MRADTEHLTYPALNTVYYVGSPIPRSLPCRPWHWVAVRALDSGWASLRNHLLSSSSRPSLSPSPTQALSLGSDAVRALGSGPLGGPDYERWIKSGTETTELLPQLEVGTGGYC